MRAGLLDLKQAQEWVVTTKLGASDKRPGTQARPSSQGAWYMWSSLIRAWPS